MSFSPRFDGVSDQAPLGKLGVSLTGLRLHEVLPLDRSRDRSRAYVGTENKRAMEGQNANKRQRGHGAGHPQSGGGGGGWNMSGYLQCKNDS